MENLINNIVLSTYQFLLMAPPPGDTKSTAPGWTSFVPFILMFVVFYFLLIRPQQKRAKEHQILLDAVETGDEVITTGGILGTVTNRKEKTVIIKIAENVKIEVLKSAIQSVTKPGGKTSSV